MDMKAIYDKCGKSILCGLDANCVREGCRERRKRNREREIECEKK